jgi:hypothetical protein
VPNYLWKILFNTIGAKIGCRQETISLKFGEEEMKFHFSKFKDKPDLKEFED